MMLTSRVMLPDGEIAEVQPYHVCTLGLEDKVLFKTEEDFRVVHNLIPICALRANVLPLADCVLNTHCHIGILAESFEAAKKFSDSYKLSIAKYYYSVYGENTSKLFRKINVRPVPVEDMRHLRNMICYILRNALDMGQTVDLYMWSSYRAYFRSGKISVKTKSVSAMSTRETRSMFKVGDKLKKVRWELSEKGIIEPASYCAWGLVEKIFLNDPSFFMKVLGLTDDGEMEQKFVGNNTYFQSVEALLKEIEMRAQKRYGQPLGSLTLEQKIPLIKSVHRSLRTMPSQLARCFGLPYSVIKQILSTR